MAKNTLPLLATQTAPPMMAAAPVVPQAYISPGLSITQILSVIKAYKKQTVIITLVFILASGVITKLMPKTYEATATLMVNFQGNDPMPNRNSLEGAPISYIATQIELMQSSEVLLPVVDRLKLTENKKYIAGYRGDGSNLREWIQIEMLKNLTIEQGKSGSQLLYVTYAADNPVEAAEVANTVAEVYSQQQYQRTGLIDLQSKVDSDTSDLSLLEQRLLDAQNQRRMLEANSTTDNAVLGATSVQTLKSQLAQQEATMAQLRTSLGAKHPQVLELQAQMNATRQALASESATYTGNANSQVRAARQLEGKLQEAVAEQRAKVLDMRRTQDEGTKYLLELESAQTVYKRALDSYDQIMFASTGHLTSVNFVSRATPPLQHSKPKASKNIAKGAVAGLFLGLLGPLAYGFFVNRRIRCRDDIERDYGIPVLVEFDALPPNLAF